MVYCHCRVYKTDFIFYSVEMIKKVLLWLFISCISIFGFSGATFVSLTSPYTPSSENITVWSPLWSYVITFGQYSNWCTLNFVDSSFNTVCSFKFNNNTFPTIDNSCSNLDFVWDLHFSLNEYCRNKYSPWILSFTLSPKPYSIVDDWLEPTIEWLWLVVFEFIPYVIYVCLWILGGIIWFYWIKWLVNYVRAVILNIFKK